jgi:hypothetical protein
LQHRKVPRRKRSPPGEPGRTPVLSARPICFGKAVAGLSRCRKGLVDRVWSTARA